MCPGSFKKLNKYSLHRRPIIGCGEGDERYKEAGLPYIGFVRRTTYLLVANNLLVILGIRWKTLRIEATFITVNTMNSYNVVFGRTTQSLQQFATSTCHH